MEHVELAESPVVYAASKPMRRCYSGFLSKICDTYENTMRQRGNPPKICLASLLKTVVVAVEYTKYP